ncbi:VOC family protein [Nocardioides sp. BYT-33-1]|uniref:VOC family protein n=1 Tax=Nocardioides sp. BYT-33-1 TaxID=3416952 RepID=UPI003F52FDEB
MTLTITTHLNLPGTARAALAFYRDVFGGRITTTTYADLGQPAESAGADRIVFGALEADNGVRLMAYDVPGLTEAAPVSTRRMDGMTLTDQPFFVSLSGETLEEVAAYWERLAVGARVVEPLAASAWSAGFGMLTDRFGVTWVLDVATPAAG